MNVLKRPPSPSNIPAPVYNDPGSPKKTVHRKLPQAIIGNVSPPKRKTQASESRIPTPLSGKRYSSVEDLRDKEKRSTNGPEAQTQNNISKTGVIYITENLIRKMSREEDMHMIFKLGLTLPKDLNKKIKFIENLEPLKNLQILSIAHNTIEKMERLDKLVNLQILDLSDNLIKKIEGIENLQQLTVLNLEDNQIGSLPAFIGKKLKCLRTFKVARNQLHSLHELYKIRALPDLVAATIEGNPVCSLQHHRQLATFLLRPLEILDGNPISMEERLAADERFGQDEIRYMEEELEKISKRLQQTEAEKNQLEEFSNTLEENEMNLRKNNGALKGQVKDLQKDVETKDQLLESRTKELSKACEKQYKLEQELAFYKLDTKFDEFWKFDGYHNEDEDDQYIDEDQSAYIGKARFKPNSMARERVLPSKAQMINLIKIIKRNDEKSAEINQTIIRDLQEALNVDLEEKRNAILEAQVQLEKVKTELANARNKAMDANENYLPRGDQVDAPQGLIDIEERERARAKLADLIRQAKEMQATIAELKDKMAEAENMLQDREEQLKNLREKLDSASEEDPDHDKLLDEVAAMDEQCHQLEEYMEQLQSLLAETETDLASKIEEIRALEVQLKRGEPAVQTEMKHGLEDLVKKLTKHLEDLKAQMKEQKGINADLEKERDLLRRRIEQLEDDVIKADGTNQDLDGLRSQLQDKENALNGEMEINDKLRGAYENLLQKLNKKKRHVGVGSHDVWRDPHLENLERQARNSQTEAERLREALEKINKQREEERRALEERLEHGQAKLDEAVQAARAAGDFEREARELDRQVQRLQAEKAALRKRVDGLEEELNKEKEDSIPWKSILTQLQSLLDDMGTGEVGRQSPSMGPSMKEKKLQRLFEDLRDKLNENIENKEEEKEALQRQLEKFQAKIEKLNNDLQTAQRELSESRQRARELEQEAQDSTQQLEQMQNRLKKALQDRSSNAQLIEEELDALQARLDDSERTATNAKREVGQLKSKLEEAQRKLKAMEEQAREAEQEAEATKGDLEEMKKLLRNANNEKLVQANRAAEEIGRLQKLLQTKQADLEQAEHDIEVLQGKLNAAEKRMKQAERKAKQLEHELGGSKGHIEDLKAENESLRTKLQKEVGGYKDALKSAREKASSIQKELEDEIYSLKNRINEDGKFIDHLKSQLKKNKTDFEKDLDGLADEIADLQIQLAAQQAKFQKAEDNNNRLLENIAKIEDENDSLNDALNALQKEAAEMLEKEKLLRAKELKELEDEIENLKGLIAQLQHHYESEAYDRELSAANLVSRDLDDLKQKINEAERDSERRDRHHMDFKKRLSDEIGRLQHAVDKKDYEGRLLHGENLALQQRLDDEIYNAQRMLSDLKLALADREREMSALRNSTEPVIAQYRNHLRKLQNQLQSKEDELNGLRQKMRDLSQSSRTQFVTANDPRLDDLSNQIEALKTCITNMTGNASILLSSWPHGEANQTYPLTQSALKVQSPKGAANSPMSPVHHHHYGTKRDFPLETIVSSSAQPNGGVHIHHHDGKDSKGNKKKKKSSRKGVTYEDEFCNVQDHEEMANEVTALENRLRNSTLSRSKLSSDNTPLKLELKELENKVEDAMIRRYRKKQLKRTLNPMDST